MSVLRVVALGVVVVVLESECGREGLAECD